MARVLVVVRDFADFRKGDHITNPRDVERFTESHPEFVVAKNVEDDDGKPNAA